MIISVSGLPGSGKSTLISNIISTNASLTQAKIKKEDDFQLIKLFKKVFGATLSEQYNFIRQGKVKTSLLIIPFLVDLLYPLVVYIEYLSFYFWYEILFPQSILITDRYAYDYFVTAKHNLKIFANPLCSLLYNFPRPSIAFYISADPEWALKNRQDRSLNKLNGTAEFLISLHETYMSIVKRHDLIVLGPGLNAKESVKMANFYIALRHRFEKISSVALIGMDGTGKSTVAMSLIANLKSVSLNGKVLHFFHDSLLNKLIVHLPFAGDKMSQKIGKAISKHGNMFWAIGNFIDGLIQIGITRLLHPNSLIVYDRYFYDFLVTFSFYDIPYRELFAKFIPYTDVQVLFVGSPILSRKRKPENSVNNYKILQTLYLNMAREYKINTLAIADFTPQQIVEEIINV